MDELMEMQLQLNSLKAELNRSNIVNNKLLKSIISQKASSINRIVWGECIVYPLTLLVFIAFCVATKTNLWLAWSFGILGFIDLLLDFRTLRISRKGISSMSLRGTAEKLHRQKKERFIQNLIGIPLTAAWVVWFFIEFVKHLDLPSDATFVITIALIIMAIIVILGVLLFLRKIEGTTSKMISEIDELEETTSKDTDNYEI